MGFLVVIGLISGCAETRSGTGASAENDHNVLTGGPITGTRIQDLPSPVLETLKAKVPTAEIAGIDKGDREGKMVYKIHFSEPTKNRSMYIAPDGHVVQVKE